MKAWQLIEKEENYCDNAVALDRRGKRVSASDKRACRWDFFGALLKCYPRPLYCLRALATVGRKIKRRNVTRWVDNPKRTHAQVLAAMKKADV